MIIRCVCGSGLGSSLLLAMNVKIILNELNISYQSVEHTNIVSFSSRGVDLVIVGADVAPVLTVDSAKLISLTNILSKDELEEKLRKHFKI